MSYPITPKWLYTLATQYLGFKDFGILHKYLCQRICEPRKEQIRLILIPRGFFKTSLFTYAHNTALALENKNIRILQCSGVLSNAKVMVMKWGKNFTHNEVFRDRFKEYCPKNPENPETKWTEAAIYLPNRTEHHAEGTIEAFGADSTIVSRHYDYMKFDDIVTPENSTTRDQLDKIIRFVSESFGLCDNRMSTPVDIIGTTWDDGDLYAHYLKRFQDGIKSEMGSNVDVIRIPATYSPNKETIGIKLPFKEGESIFPERYSTKDLKKVKKDDPETYAKFYDLDPVPIGDRSFSDFTYYSDLPGDYSQYRKFMTVDPSHTENPTSHPSAINITAVDNEKIMFCLLSWKDKIAPDKLIDKLWNFYFDYDCEALGIESYVYQKVLKYWLLERIMNDPENRYMKILELKHKKKQSKEDHIAALAPYVNAGRYRFLKSQTNLVYSLSRFPKAKDRDEPDAAAYQLHLVKPSGYKIMKKEDPNSLNAWRKRIAKIRGDTNHSGLYVGS